MSVPSFSDAHLSFLFVELDLGQSFVRMALTVSDTWLAERNLSHAQAAHDAVERFQDQLSLSPETRDKLLLELGSLRNAITAARAL
jgi:phage shock protein A